MIAKNNADKARWAELLGLYLARTLIASESYTESDIEAHVDFFRHHVCGWLGPGPMQSLPLRPACPSALTCDATPLEVSYGWKGTSSVMVRYVVDLIGLDGNPNRAASLITAQKTINELREYAAGLPIGGYRIDMLPDVWEAVTACFAHWEHKVHASPCAVCTPSTTFVGFDLASSGRASGKLYWRFPACLFGQDLIQVLDDVFALLPLHGANVEAHWAQVRRHLISHSTIEGGCEGVRPRMLSIDATRYPAPRIKLYSRCYFDPHASFADAVERHLTLDGAVLLPPPCHYATLWTRLQTHYRLEDGPASQQRYCLLAHDMLPDTPLATKLYWFAQEIPGGDGVMINDLLADFAQPAAFLQRQLDAGHFSQDSDFIMEIGMAQRDDGAFDIAAYISPALFSP
jgi:DMATS type aromatic prenyltransferase